MFYLSVLQIQKSDTEYLLRDNYQFEHNRLHLRFGGFEDSNGIDHYLFSLRKGSTELRRLNLGKKMEVVLTDLELDPDTYTVGIQAVNSAGYKSAESTQDFVVLKQVPTLTGKILQREFWFLIYIIMS